MYPQKMSGVFKKWKVGKINEKGNICTLEVNQYEIQKLIECEYKNIPPLFF